MKHIVLFFSITLLLFSCSNSSKENNQTESAFIMSDETIIIDVRTPEEWHTDGHSTCSVSIPLDELEKSMDSLRKYKQIGVVCRSGNRAEQAQSILNSNGFQQVTNLGSWKNITCKKQ